MKRNISSVRGPCVYCGEPATDRDHVVPHSFTRGAGVPRTFEHTAVVPACRDCNGALSNKMLTTIAERAAYLKTRAERKLRRQGGDATWKAHEIAALGTTLRRFVLKLQAKAARARRRITHLTAVSKCAGLDPTTYWEEFDEGGNK